jgi:hypothetical protein
MDLKTLEDWLDLWVQPSEKITRESSRKWVRAAGKIGVVFPLLPWAVFALFSILVFAVVGLGYLALVKKVSVWRTEV